MISQPRMPSPKPKGKKGFTAPGTKSSPNGNNNGKRFNLNPNEKKLRSFINESCESNEDDDVIILERSMLAIALRFVLRSEKNISHINDGIVKLRDKCIKLIANSGITITDNGISGPIVFKWGRFFFGTDPHILSLNWLNGEMLTDVNRKEFKHGWANEGIKGERGLNLNKQWRSKILKKYHSTLRKFPDLDLTIQSNIEFKSFFENLTIELETNKNKQGLRDSFTAINTTGQFHKIIELFKKYDITLYIMTLEYLMFIQPNANSFFDYKKKERYYGTWGQMYGDLCPGINKFLAYIGKQESIPCFAEYLYPDKADDFIDTIRDFHYLDIIGRRPPAFLDGTSFESWETFIMVLKQEIDSIKQKQEQMQLEENCATFLASINHKCTSLCGLLSDPEFRMSSLGRFVIDIQSGNCSMKSFLENLQLIIMSNITYYNMIGSIGLDNRKPIEELFVQIHTFFVKTIKQDIDFSELTGGVVNSWKEFFELNGEQGEKLDQIVSQR